MTAQTGGENMSHTPACSAGSAGFTGHKMVAFTLSSLNETKVSRLIFNQY
jgi:hypothetical protein